MYIGIFFILPRLYRAHFLGPKKHPKKIQSLQCHVSEGFSVEIGVVDPGFYNQRQVSEGVAISQCHRVFFDG